jgi:hypothetical protein
MSAIWVVFVLLVVTLLARDVAGMTEFSIDLARGEPATELTTATHMDIIGERNSGTNWVSSILAKNFVDGKLLGLSNNNNIYKKFRGLYTSEFGWKHGFLRRDLIEARLSKANQVVFVVILRNPYSWILSMKKLPHHAPDHNGVSLMQFVSLEWHCFGKARMEMMWERDPKSGEAYQNVIAMRTAKYKDWLDLQNVVEHVAYIRYEDIINDDGAGMVKSAAKWGGNMRTEAEFKPEYGRCGAFGWRDGCSGGGTERERETRRAKANDETYMNQFYGNPEVLTFVNSQLDHTLEESLGYEIRTLNKQT